MPGRWQTWVDPKTRRTVKHGLSPTPKGYGDSQRLGIYRGIVMRTYATNDADRAPGSSRVIDVECDVLLTKSLVMYTRVPVVQRMHGVNDASLWIPRPCTVAPLTRVSRRGSVQSPTPFNPADLDGDKVIVEFLEGDKEKPIITGALAHENTRRKVIDGSGWSESDGGDSRGTPELAEHYFRYRGVEARVNAAGDVLLDTVGAQGVIPREAEAANPDETADPINGGHVRVRLKDTQRLTIEMDGEDVLEIWKDVLLNRVRIDLGEGADERIVRGEKLTSWLLAHMHPDATGGTAPPVDPAGVPPVSLTLGDHLSDNNKTT